MPRPIVSMPVELRDLKWAIVASQHRSLRRAAEALNIRQSTLSRHLRDMEQRIGAQLFQRTNGGTSITVPGREFLESARRILHETNAALHRLQTRSRGENGRLTIGVYASLSTGNMFATLADHRRCFPEVEVQIVDGGHDELICGLASKTIDIAIMTNSFSSWDDRTLPLWCERVILAAHKRHPFAQMSVVKWSDLAGEPVLIRRNGPGRDLERLLRLKMKHFGPEHLLHQEAGLDRLLSLVAAEYGVLLMLEGATGVCHNDVIFREVQDSDGPTRLDFAAYWRRSNENPTLTPFLTLLRRRYPDLSCMRASGEQEPLIAGAHPIEGSPR